MWSAVSTTKKPGTFVNLENDMPTAQLRAQATRAVANKATDMKEIQI